MGKARGERVLLHSDVRDNTAEKSGDFFPNQKIYLYIKLKKKKERKEKSSKPRPSEWKLDKVSVRQRALEPGIPSIRRAEIAAVHKAGGRRMRATPQLPPSFLSTSLLTEALLRGGWGIGKVASNAGEAIHPQGLGLLLKQSEPPACSDQKEEGRSVNTQR